MTTHETITACENVCRDFSWFWKTFGSPQLLAAIVASSTAFIIAVRVYGLQKKVDRQMKVSEEKRLAYKRFFDAAEAYFASLRAAAFRSEADLPDAEFSELEAAKAEIAFRGGDEAVLACAEFSQHLKDYRKFVRIGRETENGPTEKTKASRDKAYYEAMDARLVALLAARLDAGTMDEKSATEKTVRRLFLMNETETKQ